MSDTQVDDKKVPDTGDKTQGDGDKKQPHKLSFTADQQEVVDTLIDRMFGKGYEKSKSEFEPKLTEAQKQIDTLAKQVEEFTKAAKSAETVDDKKTKDDKKKPSLADMEEFKQFQAQMDELREAQKALQAERDAARKALGEQTEKQRISKVRDEFLDASRDLGFIDPNEVFLLVRDQIKLDEESGSVVIMNPKTGRPRMDATLENPLSLADYLTQFAQERKHLVRASDAGGGTGAGGSKKIDTSTKDKQVDFAKMTKEEFEAFKSQVKRSATS